MEIETDKTIEFVTGSINLKLPVVQKLEVIGAFVPSSAALNPCCQEPEAVHPVGTAQKSGMCSRMFSTCKVKNARTKSWHVIKQKVLNYPIPLRRGWP